MPIEFTRTYLSQVQERYRNAKRKQKSAILDEFCRVCEFSRKHAIQILNHRVKSTGYRRPGPRSKYEIALPALKDLWQLTGKICSKKLQAALPLWLPFYEPQDRVKALLLKVSPSTIDRLLRPHRTRFGKGLSTTRPSN